MGVLLTALLGAAGAAEPAWSAQASHRSDAAQQVLGQSHRPRRQTFELARRFDAESRIFARHEYRILDLPAVGGSDADSNGHVHRLALGWQRESATDRVRLAAALAVSSNALKYPKQLEARDLRPELAMERRIGDTLRLALYADDRFGRSLLYPGFAFALEPSAAHELRLGWPHSSWRWQWTNVLVSTLDVAPDGGRWRVRDRTLANVSEVRIRAWQAGWTLRWQPFAAIAIEAGAGRRFGTTMRYRLQNGDGARVEIPAATFIRFGVDGRF
jgi:hypothetical protein